MKLLSVFLSLVFLNSVYAAIEIGGEFSYDKKIYGDQGQNKSVSRTYSGNMAWYVFSRTAIELNYAYSEDIETQTDDVIIDSTNNISITSIQTTMKTDVWGVGLRQALSGRKSVIRPMFSFGYAKQFINSSTTYTIDVNGTKAVIEYEGEKARIDSMFASFILQIYLTRYLKLNGSVKSVFEAFQFNEARDDMKYSAGLSWVF